MKQRLVVSLCAASLVGLFAAGRVQHTGDTANAIADAEQKLSALTFKASGDYVDEPLWSVVDSIAAPLAGENARLAKAKALLRYRSNPSDSESALWESRASAAQLPWHIETQAGFAFRRVGLGLAGLAIGFIAALLSLAVVSWAWRFFLARVRELSSAIRGR